MSQKAIEGVELIAVNDTTATLLYECTRADELAVNIVRLLYYELK